MNFLIGDIGGTKTKLCLFKQSKHGLKQVLSEQYKSQDQTDINTLILNFVQTYAPNGIQHSCLAVAGPVQENRCSISNLPWEIDGGSIQKSIGSESCHLINDLEAAALGAIQLHTDELAPLQTNAKAISNGNIAVIAAGTGLGQALLVRDPQGDYQAMASEGGQTSFAPHNPLEDALLQAFRQKHGTHVSYEHILSGPGLYDVYKFLRQYTGIQEPEWLTSKIKRCDDPSILITKLGLFDLDPVCHQTLDCFASIYGAATGDLALHNLAQGGVYVTGGIAPLILSVLKKGGFIQRFSQKGRLTPLIQKIPIHVCLNTDTSVIGAASQLFKNYSLI